MWVDDWKKGFLYIALAVPAFIKANLLAIGCGTCTYPFRVPTYYNFAWVPHTFGGV